MSSLFSAYVVDDDPEIIHALRSALNKLGCEVIIGETHQEDADNLVQHQKIDVAFVSLSLRHVSGRTVARTIKSTYPFSKVFLVTSWEGELDTGVLNAEGLSGVIRKPLRFSDVKRALIEHLG